MVFNGCKLLRGEPFIDSTLFTTYTDSWVANVMVGCSTLGKTLSMSYTITFHTQDGSLIQRYIGIYKCIVEREQQSTVDEKIDLWKHVLNGLICASNDASGGEVSLQNELFPKISWNQSIEKAYNEIILCDNTSGHQSKGL